MRSQVTRIPPAFLANRSASHQEQDSINRSERLKSLSSGPNHVNTRLMICLLVSSLIFLHTNLASFARDYPLKNVPWEPGAAKLTKQNTRLYEPSPLMSGSKDISDTVCNMTNGRGRGRRGPGRAVTMIRQQNRRDQGHKFRPEKLPPDFVDRPWNAFTFSATYNGQGFESYVEITSSNIREYIRGKVGLASTAQIYIKVEKARCWATSVGPNFVMPFLRGGFFETQADSTGNVESRTQLSDHGALSDPARVAYYWPLADRKNILSPGVNLTFLQMQGTVGAELTVMVNVLWYAAPAAANLQSHVKSKPDPQRDGDLSDFDLGALPSRMAALAARS